MSQEQKNYRHISSLKDHYEFPLFTSICVPDLVKPENIEHSLNINAYKIHIGVTNL